MHTCSQLFSTWYSFKIYRFDLNIFFLQVYQPVVSTVPMGIPAIRAESAFSHLLCAQENPTFYQCKCIPKFLTLKAKLRWWRCTVHCYKTFRRIPPPSTDGADSSCWVGENDCFIWAGNLRPQVPKFSVIIRNFRRFLL
jgi:hypothetical protein